MSREQRSIHNEQANKCGSEVFKMLFVRLFSMKNTFYRSEQLHLTHCLNLVTQFIEFHIWFFAYSVDFCYSAFCSIHLYIYTIFEPFVLIWQKILFTITKISTNCDESQFCLSQCEKFSFISVGRNKCGQIYIFLKFNIRFHWNENWLWLICPVIYNNSCNEWYHLKMTFRIRI